ncbi:MAG TPA: TetR/AcrR family transcriptional regulator [Deltaproteobacteria bacterium]|nr:TetR/AcrR family transcriptional regulator [Deltaproteobacteria bacterium]
MTGPTQRERLGIESRRRIIAAAAALMAERGFAGTSIAAVSEKSGLPSGSIYWHFENKEALLGAVIEEGARQWFESLPGSRLASAEVASSFADHPEFLRLLILIALERREVDEASLEVIRRVRARARDGFEKELGQLLESHGNENAALLARSFAILALAVADGLFIAQHIDPETTDASALLGLMKKALAALARELGGA